MTHASGFWYLLGPRSASPLLAMRQHAPTKPCISASPPHPTLPHHPTPPHPQPQAFTNTSHHRRRPLAAGSLTTPPCSEGVMWHLFLSNVPALSASQVKSLVLRNTGWGPYACRLPQLQHTPATSTAACRAHRCRAVSNSRLPASQPLIAYIPPPTCSQSLGHSHACSLFGPAPHALRAAVQDRDDAGHHRRHGPHHQPRHPAPQRPQRVPLPRLRGERLSSLVHLETSPTLGDGSGRRVVRGGT